MGRKCAVPHCYTGYRKCKEKASLYKVPDDDFFLHKWQEAIARDDRPITPKDYVCEKHFKEDDIQRSRVIKNVVEVYLRPKLRADAVPSVFPDLPEFILKMVKKRRKMLPQDIKQHFENMETNEFDDISESETFHNEDSEMEVKDETVQNESAFVGCGSHISNNDIEIKSENEESVDKVLHQGEEDSNRSIMYKCDECEYESKYPQNLRRHQTKHLNAEENYIHCEICPDYKTKWELTYRNHMRIKHGAGSQETYNCAMCDYKTRIKICLRRHIERHNKDITIDEKFKCEYSNCNYVCISKDVLSTHSLTHKEEEIEQKAFKCTECHYSTNSKTHILNHIKSAHNTGDDTVVRISAKESGKTIHKKRRPKGRPLYRCVKCNFQTHYHAILLKHLVKHREDIPGLNVSKVWKCSKCPYATFFQQALEAHQETDCEKDNSTLHIVKIIHKTDFVKDSSCIDQTVGSVSEISKSAVEIKGDSNEAVSDTITMIKSNENDCEINSTINNEVESNGIDLNIYTNTVEESNSIDPDKENSTTDTLGESNENGSGTVTAVTTSTEEISETAPDKNVDDVNNEKMEVSYAEHLEVSEESLKVNNLTKENDV